MYYKILVMTSLAVLSFDKGFSQYVQSDPISTYGGSQQQFLTGDWKGIHWTIFRLGIKEEPDSIENFQFNFDSTPALEVDEGKIIKHKMKNQKILGLRTTIYKVRDMEKAKNWYGQAFGVIPYFDKPFYVGFNIGGYELGLQPEAETVKRKTESVVAYWGVEDIHELYRHLIEIGGIENEKPHKVGGDIITATIKDPWGNIIGIIFNPNFKIAQ